MNKTALITGGAQRVGKSMAYYLAEKGWNLIIHANSSVDKAFVMVGEMQSTYQKQRFNAVQFNLSHWQAAKDFGQQLVDRFGPINLLVNNASKYTPGELKSMQNNVLEEMTAIHYFSPLMLSNVIANQGVESLIVNIVDAAIVNNYTEHSAYLLAKKSLAELTKVSACQYAPMVRVNAIAPGPVLPVEGKSIEVFNAVVNQTPLKREVDLSSINTSLDYLINNNNVTGQILYCDSGQHLI